MSQAEQSRIVTGTTRLLGIFGAGGFGREVLPLVRGVPGREVVFVDDAPQASLINGARAISWDEFCEANNAPKQVALAVGNSAARQAIADRCATAGIGFAHVQATNAVILDEAQIGEGAIICPFAIISSNVLIGRHFHANVHCYIAHDCIIGDFVTLAPHVCCNVNVHIADHAYIGAGVVLKQGTANKPLVIGRGAVVGMGAVVTKDVAPGEIVVGNPARPLTATR